MNFIKYGGIYMKKVVKRMAYEVKEFVLYFTLCVSPALCLASIFFTVKGMIIITGMMMVAFLLFCIVCYCLQTHKEKMAAKKVAKLKRSEG